MKDAIRTRKIGYYYYARSLATSQFVKHAKDDRFSNEVNHEMAAHKLAQKMELSEDLTGGLFGNDIYWVQAP